jgi:hypothetical protein
VTPEGGGAQVIDLCAARRMKEELAEIAATPVRVGVANCGQLSLDPLPLDSSVYVTEIGGMRFTVTSISGLEGVALVAGIGDPIYSPADA